MSQYHLRTKFMLGEETPYQNRCSETRELWCTSDGAVDGSWGTWQHHLHLGTEGVKETSFHYELLNVMLLPIYLNASLLPSWTRYVWISQIRRCTRKLRSGWRSLPKSAYTVFTRTFSVAISIWMTFSLGISWNWSSRRIVTCTASMCLYCIAQGTLPIENALTKIWGYGILIREMISALSLCWSGRKRAPYSRLRLVLDLLGS